MTELKYMIENTQHFKYYKCGDYFCILDIFIQSLQYCLDYASFWLMFIFINFYCVFLMWIILLIWTMRFHKFSAVMYVCLDGKLINNCMQISY